MRILIVGAGTIGTNLASALVKEGQDVVVIDTDERRLERLNASVDCQTHLGTALSPLMLEELGIRHTDLVVAVTHDDAVNMTVCRLADFYHVPRSLARLRNPEFIDPDCPIPPEHFGIDHVISPEGLAVAHIERLVLCPGAREAFDFEGGRIALRAMVVSEDSTVAGERVMDVRQKLSGEFLIAAIRRGMRVIIPNGMEELRIGDTVYVVCAPESLDLLLPAFAPDARPVRRTIVFGASVTGLQLARRLARKIDRVTLIEPDQRRAEHAANLLDQLGVEVLHGSALDVDLLARTSVETVDRFIALSDDDENNFMSALLFRKYGSGQPIVLTNQLHYMDIMESVDLDIVINPRVLAVSALLRHIRGSMVLTAAKLHSEEAEVLEFKTSPKSPVTRRPIMELDLPRGMLIAAVLRGSQLEIPGGTFQIQGGDRVLVFAEERTIGHVEELFR